MTAATDSPAPATTMSISVAVATDGKEKNNMSMPFSMASKPKSLVIVTNDENSDLVSPSTETTISMKSTKIEEQTNQKEVILLGLDTYLDTGEEKDGDCESVLSSCTSASSVMSKYFEPTDFLPWEDLYAKAEYAPHVGFAMVAGSFACMHPFVFFAGVVTAMGALRAAGATYDYATCRLRTAEDNENMDGTSITSCDCLPAAVHLSDTEENAKVNVNVNVNVNINDDYDYEAKTDAESVPPLATTSSSFSTNASTTGDSFEDEANLDTKGKVNDNEYESKVTGSSVPFTIESSPNIQQQATTETLYPVQWVKDNYPSLSTVALDNVEFRGLYAKEFFDVFFADDAPFGFPAFHKLRRDKEVQYGLWNDGISSEKFNSGGNDIGIPSAIVAKERQVEYHAKTNSFLGPAYAPTKKIQRAYFVSKKMLVIDIKMTLRDIPFSKQFYLIERWIVDGTRSSRNTKSPAKGRNSRNKNKNSSEASSSHCVYVTVSSRVYFTQECPFESAITKESAKQVCEISKCWNLMAQDGLKRTEETRMKRLREKQRIQQEQQQAQEHVSSALSTDDVGINKNFENDESIEIEYLDDYGSSGKHDRSSGRRRSSIRSRRSNSSPQFQNYDQTQTNRPFRNRTLSRTFSKLLLRGGSANEIDEFNGKGAPSSPKVRISAAGVPSFSF